MPNRCVSTERVTEARELAPLLFCRQMIDAAARDAVSGYRDGSEPTENCRSAMEWLTARDDRGPASFAWCCLWLGLDVAKSRQDILHEIWAARLQFVANPAAMRARFQAYGAQVRQIRRPLTALPRRERPAGSILGG